MDDIGSNHNCCVFGCSNTYKNVKSKEHSVKFYRFPKRKWNEDRLLNWISFAKRQNKDASPWVPTRNSRICSEHFLGNCKSENSLHPSYNPTIYTSKFLKSSCKVSRHERFLRRKVDDHSIVIPKSMEISVDSDPITFNLSTTTDVACQTDDCHEMDFPLSLLFTNTYLEESLNKSSSYMQCIHSNEVEQVLLGSKQHISNEAEVQVNVRSLLKDVASQCDKITYCEKSIGQDNKRCSFGGYNSIREHEEVLKDLTSASLNVFSLLLTLLPPQLQTKQLIVEDKLLLFLMKLKLGITFSSLGRLFNIHPSKASRIFYNVLNILSQRTRDWIFWPSEYTVKKTLPKCFVNNYSKCRCIIDCIEVKVERPSEVRMQNLFYSHYKGTFTIKFLVSIAPNGFISFVSKAYGGKASDAFICNDSGFFNLISSGDLILADKGFSKIKSECEQYNCILVMPPFQNYDQSQFSKSELKKTLEVASVKIHVKRVIQRINIYRILYNQIEMNMLPVIDDIIHCCCILTNLQNPIEE